MASRLFLHEELCGFPRVKKVYYNPPELVKFDYPCIKYSLSGIDQKRANNKCYRLTNRYEIIIIDPDPESDIYLELLQRFQMCSYDRRYKADNLTHDVLTLYY